MIFLSESNRVSEYFNHTAYRSVNTLVRLPTFRALLANPRIIPGQNFLYHSSNSCSYRCYSKWPLAAQAFVCAPVRRKVYLVQIRYEKERDAKGVQAVNEAAFKSAAEANLVVPHVYAIKQSCYTLFAGAPSIKPTKPERFASRDSRAIEV
jgi:hypothetical protein